METANFSDQSFIPTTQEVFMRKIFLARHGQTEWNRENRVQGRVQHIQLNENGVRQSERLAERLEKENIDIVYSSPLERALQTAEIVAEKHNLSIITHEGLAERRFGHLDGLTMDEFRKKHPAVWKSYMEDRDLHGVDGAETVKELRERGVAAFDEIIKMNPGKNILIITHAGILKVIIHHLTKEDVFSSNQHNCCLNILTEKQGTWEAEAINDTAHL
jgi:phosphoserine phosphatase